MYKLLALTCTAFVAVPFLCDPAWSRSMESGDAAIVRQDEPAVVNISTWKVRPPEKPGDAPSRIKIYASGFVIDPSGIIVTNKHVVDGALGFTVIFSNGDRVHARLLVAAEMLDLALLKVGVDHPIPSLKWGDSDALQVGDPVLTIGNQLGLGMSASGGIVSALNRDLQDSPFDSYIQTDATINHGNSGGPLLNLRGEVVGVATYTNGMFVKMCDGCQTASVSTTGTNIFYARSAASASRYAQAILASGRVERPRFGLAVKTIDFDKFPLPQRGVLVSDVDRIGPAASAIQAGDVVTDVVWSNGYRHATPDEGSWNDALSMIKPGQVVTLRLYRVTEAGARAINAMREAPASEVRRLEVGMAAPLPLRARIAIPAGEIKLNKLDFKS
jgi:S1-C subfamily serine protease